MPVDKTNWKWKNYTRAIRKARSKGNSDRVSSLKKQRDQNFIDRRLANGRTPEQAQILLGGFKQGIQDKRNAPFQPMKTAEEISAEVTPFYLDETRDLIAPYKDTTQDLTTQKGRLAESFKLQRQRAQQDAGFNQAGLGIQEGQQQQSFNDMVASRNIYGSPAQDKLQERLNAIQSLNRNRIETGDTRQVQDINTQNRQGSQDINTGLTRNQRDIGIFQKQRRQNLQKLIGQETYNTAYGQYAPNISTS